MNSASTDAAGLLQVGTGATTSCTVTFAQTHPHFAICVANVITGGTTPLAIAPSAMSTTAVTFTTAASMAAGNLTWHCM